jgi:hypothetical protein
VRSAKNCAREPVFRVCDFATLAFLSAGIAGEILQITQTWLQCRQQEEWVCQEVAPKNRPPGTTCDEEKQHNSYGNSDRRNQDDGRHDVDDDARGSGPGAEEEGR